MHANLCQQQGNNAKRNPKCTQLGMKFELLKSLYDKPRVNM